MGEIGKLRERLTIQERTQINTKGVVKSSWGTHRIVSGRVERAVRGEINQALKINTVDRVLMTVRYLSTVTTKMRVSWNSQFWDIHAIRPTELRDYMVIEAEEVK